MKYIKLKRSNFSNLLIKSFINKRVKELFNIIKIIINIKERLYNNL